MKLPLITAAVFATLSFASYADTNASAQTNQALSTAAKNGSALLGTTNKIVTTSDAKNTALSTETDRISYALGYDIGRSFKSQNVQLNINTMSEGIKDGVTGDKTLMTAKDMQETLLNFQRVLISKRQAQLAQISVANEKEGTAFLAANKTKPGVTTLPDGLQYKVIKAGEGNSPTDQDMVTVNYIGSFPNGQVFDSSYMRGKPSTFPVSQVIPAWTEALKMMKPGAVWEIYVPPTLAYGEHAVGPIGPDQTLVFKIELIAVNPEKAGMNIPAANHPVQLQPAVVTKKG